MAHPGEKGYEWEHGLVLLASMERAHLQAAVSLDCYSLLWILNLAGPVLSGDDQL